VTVRDWAVIFAVIFWGVLVVAASAALWRSVGLLEQATTTLRQTTDKALVTMDGVNEAVSAVNVELARVDTIVAGVQSITHTTDQLVGVVHATVSNPLIKAAAFAAGAARASRQFRD
jgi:hypothetical protein